METEPTMPFGKHKGKKLTEVPKGYARWCLETCTLSPSLRSQLRAVADGKPVPPTPKWEPSGDDWH